MDTRPDSIHLGFVCVFFLAQHGNWDGLDGRKGTEHGCGGHKLRFYLLLWTKTGELQTTKRWRFTANQPSTIDGMFSEGCVCFFLRCSCSPYLGKWSKLMNIRYIEHAVYLFVKWVLFNHQLQINSSGAMLFQIPQQMPLPRSKPRLPRWGSGEMKNLCLLFTLASGIVKQLFACKTCKLFLFFLGEYWKYLYPQNHCSAWCLYYWCFRNPASWVVGSWNPIIYDGFYTSKR